MPTRPMLKPSPSDELNLRETYIHTGKTSDTILAKQEQLAPSCARC